jgi:hypothetical protein
MKLPIFPRDMTAAEFAAELEHHGFRVFERESCPTNAPALHGRPL